MLFAAETQKIGIQADTTETKGNTTYATGHVRITDRGTTMQADRAVYDVAGHKITLDGAAQLEQRKDKEVVAHATSPHIVYHLDNQTFETKGPSKLVAKNQ